VKVESISLVKKAGKLTRYSWRKESETVFPLVLCKAVLTVSDVKSYPKGADKNHTIIIKSQAYKNLTDGYGHSIVWVAMTKQKSLTRPRYYPKTLNVYFTAKMRERKR